MRLRGTSTISIAVAGLLTAVGLGVAIASPAHAAEVNFQWNTADQPVGTLAVSGFADDSTVQVSVFLQNAPAGTSFRLGSTTGLTPAYGYSFGASMQQIVFTGTTALANASLATMLMSTGAATGDFTIQLTASLPPPPDTYYYPVNGSYYRHVSSSGIPWTNARNAALTLTYSGATGYLASITSEGENAFTANNVNASDIWIGASDAAAAGVWKWDVGPEAGVQFWQGNSTGTVTPPFNYASWALSEPSSGAGQRYAATNWRGTRGQWTALPNSPVPFASGYLAEFSPPGGGFTGVTTVAKTASVFAPPPPPPPPPPAFPPGAPTNVTGIPGNGNVTLSWQPPVDPGTYLISAYLITVQPEGRTYSVPASPLTFTVPRLVNGTAYTFTVAAYNDAGWGPPSSPSAPITPAPELPGPPTQVTAAAGDASATVSWLPPVNSGSSPVTRYRATAQIGGQSCILSVQSAGGGTGLGSRGVLRGVGGRDGMGSVTSVSMLLEAATPLSCVINELTNGTQYTFTVEADNGYGWGAPSDPSNAVTPSKPVVPSISISGTRTNRVVTVKGSTTGFGMGGIVTPWLKKGGPGQVYVEGRDVFVNGNGTFLWSRKVSGPVVWIYFSAGETRSNEIRLSSPG